MLNRFRWSIFLNQKLVYGLYILLAVVAALKQYLHHTFNNYLIFKYTFWHLIDLEPLYVNSPLNPYLDCNHYGPAFALFIAPFAVLPDWAGTVLWNVANVIVLLWGIFSLPLNKNTKIIIGYICAHEALTALFSYQFNVALTGTILLSFSYILKKENFKSAFFIAFGTMVKLYGIVSLAFFFFVKDKWKFILYGLICLISFFLVPMIFSSPAYILKTYHEWYISLVEKNDSNTTLDSFQDISLMGLVRRVAHNKDIPNGPMLLGGLALFLLPYMRISQYKEVAFRLMLLASTLIFTVIFSTGSESPTYIIAFAGIAIWFMLQPKKNWLVISLLIFAFVVTSLSPTDIIPRDVRYFIRIYSLKALPCAIIWFTIIFQMLTMDFKKHDETNQLSPVSDL
ncbi:glycosyltransferase family 87 protein [Pedobacter frigidisoli]|uniref:glycosyltransferase family 87 protein n=1 Tax=Pedobacter frigidisoli TaxID=2530455 RepID=UPI00292F30E8|nr:glycosyltransferase family 87 protein [Pedobacter frigidisoli]